MLIGYKLQVTDYRLQVTGYRLQVALDERNLERKDVNILPILTIRDNAEFVFSSVVKFSSRAINRKVSVCAKEPFAIERKFA